MKEIIQQIFDAIENVIKTFFSNELDIISDEALEILSVPEDAKLYREACISKERPLKVTFSTGKTIELI